MNYILFEYQNDFKNFLPLTYTRPISEIRIGILTIKKKWQKYLNSEISYKTADYLSEKYPIRIEDDNIIINSIFLPDKKLSEHIKSLKANSYLKSQNILIAANIDKESAQDIENIDLSKLSPVEYEENVSKIGNMWDIFSLNGTEIQKDFLLLTSNRISEAISPTNKVFNERNIFIEKGAVVECSVLNAKDGYIYIGKEAEVMENCVIRGSFALCEHSQLKVGAIIYGPTTIGPFSKFGGEINNIVVFGYSNKAHDGFLGNSVIGEWCNLGAGTNNSNLKNNYEEVKLWNYAQQRFVRTGLQFCGLIMGDHSKCGINTMFNTGTVVGVSTNIYGSGFPRNFIPSFMWGGSHGFITYQIEKAIETAKKVMKRRNIDLSDIDLKILHKIYDLSDSQRKM